MSKLNNSSQARQKTSSALVTRKPNETTLLRMKDEKKLEIKPKTVNSINDSYSSKSNKVIIDNKYD